MSERGSFTTQYFYSDDYEVIRKALDQGEKYLCVSPPAKWGDFSMPIVSGKVGSLFPDGEWMAIEDALRGVVTKDTVKVVVMCDDGAIVLVTKSPEGEVSAVDLEEGEVYL